MHLNSTCTDVKHASERVMQFSLYDCFPHAFSVPGVQLIKHGEVVNNRMAGRKRGRTGSRRVVHCTLQTQTSLVFFLLRYRRVVSPHASFYQLDTRNTMVYFLLINILFLGIDLENISQQAEAIFGGST